MTLSNNGSAADELPPSDGEPNGQGYLASTQQASLAIADRIEDMMATPDAANAVIDLASVFRGEGLTYTVENSDGAVVNAVIADGKLVLDFGDYGFSDVRVTATDADGNSVSDNFRARVAGENAYTIAVLPDTQVYTYSGELDQTYNRMTEWLVANKDGHNIQFAVHVGDLTQNNIPQEWDIVIEAMSKLNGVIPFSVLPGNHDGAGSSGVDGAVWNQYYSADQLAAANPGTFGGTYDQEPTSGMNTYSSFTAPDGTKWLVLALEFNPRPDVVRWAGDVIEDHADHRVILSTHFYTNFAGRNDAASGPLYDEFGADDQRTDVARTNGEMLYRELVSKYPNITFTFSGHVYGDGAETLVSYNQYGDPVFQMLANYQDGGAKEISGNGDTMLGGRGGQGAIRLLVIDPDRETISTETYFANFDEYMTGSRGSDELDRDGLTGPYRDQQDLIENVYLGTPELAAMAKAGTDQEVHGGSNGDVLVTLDGSGTRNPGSDGGLVYAWFDGEGRQIAAGVSPTVALAPGNQLVTLKVTDSAGRITTDSLRVSAANAETLLVDTFNDGDAAGWSLSTRVGVKNSGSNVDASDIGNEDRLADYSDSANKFIVWTDAAAQNWSNYVFEATLQANDNDGIGAVFYYQNDANHYRVVFDGETNTRTLLKVHNGVTTVLANVHQFTPFEQDMELKIVVENGTVTVFLDGHDVFGAVVDTNPLAGGTVGFYSNNQRTSLFDNVAVNPVALTAHAGDDQRALDLDHDGKVTVSLSADGTYGLAGEATYTWTDHDGNVVATGRNATVEVAAGRHELTLTVTDEAGKSAVDHVVVDGVGANRLLVAERFDSAASLSNWTIVDEGEFGGVGPNGTASQWEWQDGRLVQLSDLASRQLVLVDASPTDVYDFLVGAGFWKIMINLQNGVKPAQNVLPVDWANATADSIWSALSGYLDAVSLQYAWDPAMTTEIKTYFGEFFSGQAQTFSWPAAADGPVWNALFEWVSPVTWPSEWEGEDNVWERGWSPHGDGQNVLRKGTYALWDDPAASSWTNYAVEATIETPDNGALGLLVYYQDPGNYFKIELDANGDFDRTPENGAGSLFQIIQLKNGVEKYLYQVPAKYTPGEAFALRVEVFDNRIMVLVNGEEVFAYAIEDRAQTQGTVGLFSWGSAGVSFDDVFVYDLTPEIIGTDGDDELVGGEGADSIYGRQGDDQIAGDKGKDILDGGTGDDVASGGADDDVLLGGEGDDELDGGAGNDILVGGVGDDALGGGDGIDTASYADDTAGVVVDLAAGDAHGDDAGTDTLAGIENVTGGAGNDTLTGDAAANLLDGGLGSDTINGGAGSDVLLGGAGNDTLAGGDGDDVLAGGAGNDTIAGGAGFDTLDLSDATGAITLDTAAGKVSGAGIGSDTFTSIEAFRFGAGNDVVTGGNGDEIFDGGAGNDTLKGGAGDDQLAGGDGNDTVDGGSGDDVVTAGAGDDILKGGSGDDTVDGGAGVDNIDAGSGDDIVTAGAGNDIVAGGSGDDVITGGGGNDVLTGGSGHDVFVFAAGFGKDTVKDFVLTGSSSDTIEFSSDLFDSYAEVMSHAAQAGSDVLITIDADTTLTLANIKLAALATDDFRFA